MSKLNPFSKGFDKKFFEKWLAESAKQPRPTQPKPQQTTTKPPEIRDADSWLNG